MIEDRIRELEAENTQLRNELATKTRDNNGLIESLDRLLSTVNELEARLQNEAQICNTRGRQLRQLEAETDPKLRSRLHAAKRETEAVQSKFHRLRRLYKSRVGEPPLWARDEVTIELIRAVICSLLNLSGVGYPKWMQ